MDNIKLVGDRLSLTLSLVAIISAAITSYYQFFHHATLVSHFQSEIIDHWPSLEGDHYQDSIAARVTLLNSGSTPVAIVKSRLFLTSDTLYALAEFKKAAKDRKLTTPTIRRAESTIPKPDSWMSIKNTTSRSSQSIPYGFQGFCPTVQIFENC